MNPLQSLGRREARLVVSFVMLDEFGLTPLDLGLDSWDEVDPWWAEAMLEIKGGFNAAVNSKNKKRLLDHKGRPV